MTDLLWVHAAPVEAAGSSALRPLCTGVGKAAAAAAVAAALERSRPAAVVAFGVCGAFPDRHRAGGPRLHVGDLCVVRSERFGDEGVEHGGGFDDLATMGLGSAGPFAADARLVERAATALRAPVVDGATVSTVSGTDARSAAVAARTGAQVETMEGAAVALACARAGVPWVGVRCVSNETGDRERGGWRLADACARLAAAVEVLAAALRAG